jgi:D-alanyl-D-alanine carboxypeptidase
MVSCGLICVIITVFYCLSVSAQTVESKIQSNTHVNFVSDGLEAPDTNKMEDKAQIVTINQAEVKTLIETPEEPPKKMTAEEAEDQLNDVILWLVNKKTPLSKDFEPEGMVKSGGYNMRPETRDAWETMLSAMKKDGISGLYLASAFRTYDKQRALFTNKKTMYLGLGYDNAAATAMTTNSIAYPGASEHQTGLAIDVTLNGTLNRSFANTKAGQWINAHCHEYGFVVRYPEDKKEITEIMYEPWHLRYVGAPHAAFMKEQNFCLEEYITYLNENLSYIFWLSDTEYYKTDYLDSLEGLDFTGNITISTDRYGPGAK